MLTPKEKTLAADASVMLSKNKIIQEVYNLFGHLSQAWQSKAVHLPAEIVHLHPKISRGENYLSLPWVMLDYPRLFSGRDAFAIRTLFWWGHSFSLHLLLQGKYMPLLASQKMGSGWHFSTATTPWQHHYDAEHSLPAENVTAAELETQSSKSFYKLSAYLPLQQWDEAETFLDKKFGEVLQMVNG